MCQLLRDIIRTFSECKDIHSPPETLLHLKYQNLMYQLSRDIIRHSRDAIFSFLRKTTFPLGRQITMYQLSRDIMKPFSGRNCTEDNIFHLEDRNPMYQISRDIIRTISWMQSYHFLQRNGYLFPITPQKKTPRQNSFPSLNRPGGRNNLPKHFNPIKTSIRNTLPTPISTSANH